MTPTVEKARYRPNVCAVITDAPRRQVLMFRRVDATLGEYRWQFPQGGLDTNESPEEGLLRELREEIGTAEVTVIGRLPAPLRYEYPPDVLAALAKKDPRKAGFVGQSQHWFLMHLNVAPEDLNFDHQPQEFDAWRWVTPEQAVELVVPFKRSVYLQAMTGFKLL